MQYDNDAKHCPHFASGYYIYYSYVLKATYFVGFRIPVLSSGIILSAPIVK